MNSSPRASQKPLVIIFAAGRGSRLRPHTRAIPKCLLKVGGKTLIERQVEACESAGLTDILVITGYRANLIRRVLGSRVRYAHNERYASTQTLHSFHCTRRQGKGRSHIHIDADNCFDPSLVRQLAQSSNQSALMVDFDADLDEEATKALVRNGKVMHSSKRMHVANVESTGLLKLDMHFANALYDFAQKMARKGEVKLHMFDGINPLLSRHDLHAEPINGAAWIEIDFLSDLRRAQRMVFEINKKGIPQAKG